jgi:hypothetical protein
MPLEERAGVTLSPIDLSVKQQLTTEKVTLRLGITVENFYGDVVNMLRLDLARKFGVSPDRVVFQNLVAGSVLVDVYFLPPQSAAQSNEPERSSFGRFRPSLAKEPKDIAPMHA